jgi:hypothetical protein
VDAGFFSPATDISIGKAHSISASGDAVTDFTITVSRLPLHGNGHFELCANSGHFNRYARAKHNQQPDSLVVTLGPLRQNTH